MMYFRFRNLAKLKFVMAEIYENDHANPSLKADTQRDEKQQEMMPIFTNTEPVRKRENRFTQVLFESIRFTWSENLVEVLQNELHSIGLDGTVLDEDPVLVFALKTRLSRRFRRKLLKYKPFLKLINQRHWRWQIEMIRVVLFKKPIQEDSYSLTEILKYCLHAVHGIHCLRRMHCMNTVHCMRCLHTVHCLHTMQCLHTVQCMSSTLEL